MKTDMTSKERIHGRKRHSPEQNFRKCRKRAFTFQLKRRYI